MSASNALTEYRQAMAESEDRIDEFHEWENSVRTQSAHWTEQLAEASEDQNAGLLHGVNTFLFG